MLIQSEKYIRETLFERNISMGRMNHRLRSLNNVQLPCSAWDSNVKHCRFFRANFKLVEQCRETRFLSITCTSSLSFTCQKCNNWVCIMPIHLYCTTARNAISVIADIQLPRERAFDLPRQSVMKKSFQANERLLPAENNETQRNRVYVCPFLFALRTPVFYRSAI